MSYLADLRDYLIAQGIEAGTVFINRPPTSPAGVVVLRGANGSPPLLTTEKDAIARPVVQVWTRDTTEEAAWARAKAVETAFRGLQDVQLNGTNYNSVMDQGTASPLTLTNSAITLVQNFEVLRSE